MTDKERWIHNEQLLYHAYDPNTTRRFTDVVKGLEAKGWKPLVVEVRRSRARQLLLLAKGASRTWNSKHLSGQAMDVIDARWKWADLPVEFAVDLNFLARGVGLTTGLLWGLKGQVRDARELYLHRGDRERAVQLLTAKRGWDVAHVEVPGV